MGQKRLLPGGNGCNPKFLWHDLDSAKLPKVLIKSKCFRDAEAFHHDPAATVRKAPVLIGKALKDLPSTKRFKLSCPMHGANAFAKELTAQTSRPLKFVPGV